MRDRGVDDDSVQVRSARRDVDDVGRLGDDGQLMVGALAVWRRRRCGDDRESERTGQKGRDCSRAGAGSWLPVAAGRLHVRGTRSWRMAFR